MTDSCHPNADDSTQVAELKLAVFISGHRPTLPIDHLGELRPKLDKKSFTLHKIKVHRTNGFRLLMV